MKVKELIAFLKDMPQNLEVYGYCDHGQSPEMVRSPSVCYTKECEYTLWEEWSADKDEADEQEYAKQFVLL